MFILYEIPERLKEQEGRAITIMLSRRRSPRHDAPTDHAPYVGIEPRLTRLADAPNGPAIAARDQVRRLPTFSPPAERWALAVVLSMICVSGSVHWLN